MSELAERTKEGEEEAATLLPTVEKSVRLTGPDTNNGLIARILHVQVLDRKPAANSSTNTIVRSNVDCMV